MPARDFEAGLLLERAILDDFEIGVSSFREDFVMESVFAIFVAAFVNILIMWAIYFLLLSPAFHVFMLSLMPVLLMVFVV